MEIHFSCSLEDFQFLRNLLPCSSADETALKVGISQNKPELECIITPYMEKIDSADDSTVKKSKINGIDDMDLGISKEPQVVATQVSPNIDNNRIAHEDRHKDLDGQSLLQDFDEKENTERVIEDSLYYEAKWSNRKNEIEVAAEQIGDQIHARWKMEGKSLEDTIEESLKDHKEMYAKAHALRKQFDFEKNRWSSKVLQMVRDQRPLSVFNYNNNNNRSNLTDEYEPQSSNMKEDFLYDFEDEPERNFEKDFHKDTSEFISPSTDQFGNSTGEISHRSQKRKRPFLTPTKLAVQKND